MSTIICTVGTSIANDCPSLKALQAAPSPWTEGTGSLAEEIDARLRRTPTIARQSAELNSLYHLGISDADRIILLATDTADGHCCAMQLRAAILRIWKMPDDQVKIERIEGLQVRNGDLLRKHGLPNLIKTAVSHIESRSGDEIILNPTGGFKGIVPFLTVLGMLFRLRTVYIFEFADQLISLPPLPFSFDLDLFTRALPALRFLEKEVAVSEQAFLAKIDRFDPAESNLFLSLTEPFDDHTITLSPLAFSFLKVENQQSTVYIRPEAFEKLLRLTGEGRLRLERHIESARNPISRNAMVHTLRGTDLIALKQSSTPERPLGFMRNGCFHVTHVFASHDEYENAIRTIGNKTDYLDASFVPWESPQDLGANPIERDALAEERDRLIVQVRALNGQITSIRKDKDNIELHLLTNEENWKNERTALASKRDAARQESTQARERIRQLESMMGWRGFFKRLFGGH